ncbi:MAG TPA: hypothetical protein VNK82_14460 [Terriglobales bacterium]|nr:hypothetical protein [Terriglobales bacterium]
MRVLRGIAVLVLALSSVVFAREGKLDPSPPVGITPAEIIQRFAAKEKEFKLAREQYTFRQDAKMQTLMGNQVDGEWRQVVDITFDNRGRRVQQVVFAPAPTLRRIGVTREDMDDLENRLPFVLTTDEIGDYTIDYVGQQRVDELDTYVFDVRPRRIEKNRRYFEGRIWVDNLDFQIVKTYGKNVPDIRSRSGENLFPRFTTYREQIDGKYWFPTYTRADDTLHFSNQDVDIRMIVRYSDYKRFGADVRITYEGKEIPRVEQPSSKNP